MSGMKEVILTPVLRRWRKNGEDESDINVKYKWLELTLHHLFPTRELLTQLTPSRSFI